MIDLKDFVTRKGLKEISKLRTMTFSCENEIVFLHCYDYKRVFGFQTLEAKINIDPFTVKYINNKRYELLDSY